MHALTNDASRWNTMFSRRAFMSVLYHSWMRLSLASNVHSGASYNERIIQTFVALQHFAYASITLVHLLYLGICTNQQSFTG
jgi:hypothetical protein